MERTQPRATPDSLHAAFGGVDEAERDLRADIDVFRLDGDGQVIERWDVLRAIPDHSSNDSGVL